MGSSHGHYRPDDSGPKKSRWELLKSSARLLSYLKPYWPLAVALLAINLIQTALHLIHPHLFKYFVDLVLIGKDYEILYSIVLAVVSIILARAGLGFIYTYRSHWVGQKIILTLRNDLYEHVQALSVRFFESKPTGDIMARVTSDSEQVEQLIVHAAERLLTSVLTLVCITAYMFITDARLAAMATTATARYTTRYARLNIHLRLDARILKCKKMR